jgi:hypothetical protein
MTGFAVEAGKSLLVARGDVAQLLKVSTLRMVWLYPLLLMLLMRSAAAAVSVLMALAGVARGVACPWCRPTAVAHTMCFSACHLLPVSMVWQRRVALVERSLALRMYGPTWHQQQHLLRSAQIVVHKVARESGVLCSWGTAQGVAATAADAKGTACSTQQHSNQVNEQLSELAAARWAQQLCAL